MVEFSEGKFILCRELFLTRSSVNRTECSIPFCDRGVFRMFISSTASCTYNKVYFIVIFHTFHSDPLHMIKQNKLLLFHMESGECYV